MPESGRRIWILTNTRNCCRRCCGRRPRGPGVRYPWVRCPRWLRWGLLVPENDRSFTGFAADRVAGYGEPGGELEKLPDGLTELMCHPGRFGPELKNAATRLKESRADRVDALTSGESICRTENRGI